MPDAQAMPTTHAHVSDRSQVQGSVSMLRAVELFARRVHRLGYVIGRLQIEDLGDEGRVVALALHVTNVGVEVAAAHAERSTGAARRAQGAAEPEVERALVESGRLTDPELIRVYASSRRAAEVNGEGGARKRARIVAGGGRAYAPVNEETYACAECPAKYDAMRELLAHAQKVHGAGRCHGCPHCTKFFPTSNQLRDHVSAVHEKKRPFVCPVCGSRFGLNHNLLRHIRTVHPVTEKGQKGKYPPSLPGSDADTVKEAADGHADQITDVFEDGGEALQRGAIAVGGNVVSLDQEAAPEHGDEKTPQDGNASEDSNLLEGSNAPEGGNAADDCNALNNDSIPDADSGPGENDVPGDGDAQRNSKALEDAGSHEEEAVPEEVSIPACDIVPEDVNALEDVSVPEHGNVPGDMSEADENHATIDVSAPEDMNAQLLVN